MGLKTNSRIWVEWSPRKHLYATDLGPFQTGIKFVCVGGWVQTCILQHVIDTITVHEWWNYTGQSTHHFAVLFCDTSPMLPHYWLLEEHPCAAAHQRRDSLPPHKICGVKAYKISAESYGTCTDWKQSSYVCPKTFIGTNSIESRIMYNHPDTTITSTNDHKCTIKKDSEEVPKLV